MTKKKKPMAFLLLLTLLLSGCSGTNPSTSDNQTTISIVDENSDTDKNTNKEAANNESGDDTDKSDSVPIVEYSFAENESDMFTDRDYGAEYDENRSTLIQLNGDSISCDSKSVKISGTTVTIVDEGTYILSGSLDDGMIIIDAEDTDKPQLVFDNVSITSSTSAPLYILEADKVVVTLASDSENSFANGGTFTAIDDNNIDAAIFSKQDLTFNGSGTLTVTSPVGHGIVCKDDLCFTSGTYTIQSASHGLDVNDSVRITNANLTIDAGKDGIHVENLDSDKACFVYTSSGTVNISAEGDGIDSQTYIQIEGGTFDIVSGGGSANATKEHSDSWGGFMGSRMPGEETSTDSDENSTSIKAMKVSGDFLITDGTFTIDSADDAVHSNTSVTVNGGTFDIASGDDAFHADETLTVTAGTINVTESYEGLEGLDIRVSGGDINLIATDDGLNAAGGTDSSGFGGPRGQDMFGGGMSAGNGSITISGGNLYVNASGDGIDANGSLTISDGYIVVTGPTQGDTATLDYDTTAVITGGTFIGTGARQMAQNFSDAEQGLIALTVGEQTGGTPITITDASGNEVITYTPELPFNVIIISSPDIIARETYTITVGSTTGEFQAN